MQSKGLLEVIENLMEGEMTAKDPIKNPQEETDEMEETAEVAANKEGNDGQGSGGKPANAGGDPDKEEINKAPVCNEEEECDEEDEPVEEETGEKLESPPSKDEVGDKQADCCDPEGNAEGGEKVAGDPDKEEINKAPVVNEGEEIQEAKKLKPRDLVSKVGRGMGQLDVSDHIRKTFKGVDAYFDGADLVVNDKTAVKGALRDPKMTIADLEDAVRKSGLVKEEEEVAESEDPNHTKINKAPELKSGSGKVAGKDGKMNVEAADCDEEEVAESEDPNHTKINKAPELKSGSGKVAGKDGKMNVEASDCDEEDENIEELTDKQQKLPDALKKAIVKKEGGDPEEEVEEASCDDVEEADLDDDEVDTLKKVAAKHEEDEVEEELSAKQKKLDIDGDGEIGADDLKKVRAGQTAEEADCDEEEDLEESFKTKAAIIFETAVNEKVNTKIEAIQEEYNNKLNEEINTINEKVGEYIDYAVQEWLRENKLEIKYSLRTEISENFIKGLKTLFEENYIEIPEEDISVVDELTETVESYKEQLEEQTSELDEARKEILEFHRQATLDEITEGLTQTQALKLEKLSESVEAVDIAEFKFKVEALKESYFDENGEAPLLSEEVLDGMGLVEEEEVQAPASTVDMYAQFLGKTIQK